MRYPILLLLLIVSLPACKRMGAQHLPRATMQKVLIDIHIAEVYSTEIRKDSLHRSGADKNMDSLARYYKEIFAHYNITQQQFQQSLGWYRAHPEELDSVYVHMIPEVNKIQ